MNLPDGFDSLLARLLDSRDGDHPPTVTDKATASVLKEFPVSMDVMSLLSDLYTADPDFDWSPLDPHILAIRMVNACPEFAHLAADDGRAYGRLIRWVWRRKTAVKNDRATLGTTSIVSKADRDLWPDSGSPAPWWRITLSLQAWISLSDMDRMRLVHHELCHVGIDADAKGNVKPCINGHDIEENLQTVARFGLMDKSQSLVVAAAMSHPTTPERMRSWFVDPQTGQGALWPPPLGQDVIGGRS